MIKNITIRGLITLSILYCWTKSTIAAFLLPYITYDFHPLRTSTMQYRRNALQSPLRQLNGTVAASAGGEYHLESFQRFIKVDGDTDIDRNDGQRVEEPGTK